LEEEVFELMDASPVGPHKAILAHLLSLLRTLIHDH